MIPITRLTLGDEETAAVAEVLRSGWIASGSRGAEFESLVARYVGAKQGVATSSCTTALHLALLACDVQAGDEVICPSFSFIATANAILYARARPVFVDIDPRTFNIAPELLEEKITSRTKAILPVSQIGLPADIPEIMDVARRHGLKVVEDAACALGGVIQGARVGSLSDFTCFSFDPRKILTTGEGGMITTQDEAAAERLRRLRAHGASVPVLARHTSTSVILEGYPEVGFNYRMTDIQAAIGIVQMSRLETILAKRRQLAERYNELLAGDERIVTPHVPSDRTHVFQSYCIWIRSPIPRITVMERLSSAGIASRRILAIHLEPFYRELDPSLHLAATERAARESLLLPLYPGLTEGEQDHVVASLKRSLD